MLAKETLSPEQSELGKKSEYEAEYNPDKLFPIPRSTKRAEIGIISELPFYGFDCWNHYEVSWLNLKGKPIVATAEIIYDCNSPNIIESKSMKLYFNSFNNTQFSSKEKVENIISNDLEKSVCGKVFVKIKTPDAMSDERFYKSFDGICLDNIDVSCTKYTPTPDYLTSDAETEVDEILFSDILKSNCLVTNQPDWGSVQIAYKGKKINHEGLLKYLVSFRNHNEFHEQCIERIFVDIMSRCKPQELTVHGRYTRRGGLDINPYRSTKKIQPQIKNLRLYRQ